MDRLSPALAARSAVPAASALARPLTDGESAHLDRLRDWLRGDGTDASDAAALDARWERLLQTHPPQVPTPAGVVAAIGIAVGDLLVASVADAVWRMCPGPDGATPGVLLLDRPHMPVLPVLDAHARWRVRSSGWTVDYVQRAAAHLQAGRPQVPTPHASPDAPDAPEAAVADATAQPEPGVTPTSGAVWAPTFVADTQSTDPAVDDEPPTREAEVRTEPETAAWTPTFVEDAAPEPEAETAAWTPTLVENTTPEAGTEAWTPTFVEDTTPEPDTETAAWTPTLVENTTPEPETEAWTPTFVEDTTPEPDTETAAWTPTLVENTTSEAETEAWTPTFVEDTAPEPETEAWTPTFVEDAAPEPETETAAPEPWEPTPATSAYPTPGRGMPVTSQQALTPEDLPHRPSERVQDLALRALELALDRAVRDAAGCAPFVLVREGNDVEVIDFVHTDAGATQARDAARSGGYTAAAIAWTSPADGSRPYPRVVVDASSAGRPGIRVAHSFVHDELGGHEVGGPQVVGQSAPVL
ncbi:hypothetical protein [Cellulomonas dongxiuzhuiae]|uniref:DUF3806 domain-containing protein n=1 Tax=Cellulomonas dongxiuzhuiae TaxID=2819979 RepID=A0ABX8GL62_9CELL|nr:hypothetical protein [Cellulomonas dongxiuzhuiae]MBO3095684.1 hypothetical protein [Cellulomonas dongxiuzhuiae]QWC16637.1 hypothetical protein KKR89_02980 [Cellulomonas dongxiuzhuiae]